MSLNDYSLTGKFVPLTIAGTLAMAAQTLAADVTWDTAPGTIGVGNGTITGGLGTWNTTNGNWTVDAGANNIAWNNAANDTALFGGTAGIVTLGTNISVSGMEFATGGYTVNGGGNTITLGNNGGIRSTNSPGPSLWTNAGTTTINANINNGGFLFTTVGGGSAILNGAISGSGGFSTYNNSNVTLAGNNTYTGKTSITTDTTGGSSLTVSSFNSVNADINGVNGIPSLTSSSLGAPTTVANGTIDLGNSGKQATNTLVYTGAGETTDRVINIQQNGNSSRIIQADGSGLLKFTSAMTSNGTTTNTSRTGKFVLSGTGDGEIVQDLPGIYLGGLEKAGSGTWTVAGASVGNIEKINVADGKLLVNGTMNVTTTVTVASGATLGGSGTVGGAITVNNGGTLSPGNSAGQFNVGNSLTLAATSNTFMELGGTTLGTTYDNITIDVAGAMAYGGNLNVVNLGLYNMDLTSFTYDLFDLNGVSPTGDFASVKVNSIGLTNSGGLWTGANGGVSYTFAQATGDLTITAIPEPTAALLGCLGMLALLRRRR